MLRNVLSAALLLIFIAASTAFLSPLPVPSLSISRGTVHSPQIQAQPDRTKVALKSTKKKKGAFDEGLRTKLVSESIAPWRTLRLFLYGALGSGAAVGGFITLAGVAAALSGARTDVDLNTEVCHF